MADDKQERERLREFRRVTANVVADLRSREIRDTFAAITLPELLNQQLLMLVGDGKRLGRKQQLQRTQREFADAIEAIKGTPPSAFRQPDPDEDVNTEPGNVA